MLVKTFSWAAIVLAGLGIASGQQHATKQVIIVDPALQMPAVSLQIPADWIFEGTMVPGPSCASVPNFVYRAVSPDGIAQTKALPPLSWSWGRVQPAYAPAQRFDDCLKWDKEVPATTLLKYMIGVLQVGFERDEPIPASKLAQLKENENKQNDWFAARTQPGQPVASVKMDLAAARVQYRINNIPVEEVVDVLLSCNDFPTFTPSTWSQNQTGRLNPSGWVHVHTCTGFVTRNRARQGSIETVRPLLESISKSFTVNQEWQQKWTAAVEAFGAKLRAIGEEDGRNLLRNSELRESQMLRMNAQQSAAHDVQLRQQHEMQDATRRGTDMSMRRAQDATDARSRIAGDWADYALDQQKRRDPATGEITKDPSQYSYTWIGESGQHYQTNDSNDNPNGRLKGNWTLQQNVR